MLNLKIACGQLERLLRNKGKFFIVLCVLHFKSGFGVGLLLFTVVDCISTFLATAFASRAEATWHWPTAPRAGREAPKTGSRAAVLLPRQGGASLPFGRWGCAGRKRARPKRFSSSFLLVGSGSSSSLVGVLLLRNQEEQEYARYCDVREGKFL